MTEHEVPYKAFQETEIKAQNSGQEMTELRQERVPQELAQERLVLVDNQTDIVVQDGIRQLEEANKSVGLSPEAIASVQQESGIFQKLIGLQEKIKALVGRTRQHIQEEASPVKGPPIKEGEEFTPYRELAGIRWGPREGRKQRLQEFKEKLAYQQEGLAAIQEWIVYQIRKNPDTPLEHLVGWVRDSGSRFGMDRQQEYTAETILETYTTLHERVRAIHQEYPGPRDLFQVMFGQAPQGEVEVIEGPMTLYFRCHNPADYALIYSQAFIQGRDVTEADVTAANLSGGVSIGTALVEGLEGAIIAENAQGRPFDQKTESVYVHEEQHAIKRLFTEERRRMATLSEITQSNTQAEKEAALRRYLRAEREFGEQRGKDEILAYMKDGRWGPEAVFKIMTTPREQEGLYDYFADEKISAVRAFSLWLGDENHPWIEESVKQVYEAEYQQLLRSGIEAARQLLRQGYTKEQTTALLVYEPLSKWNKVARRLTEAKKVQHG